jgi:hypothetical protein
MNVVQPILGPLFAGAEATGVPTNMEASHNKNLLAAYDIEKTKGKAFEQGAPCLAMNYRRGEGLFSNNTHSAFDSLKELITQAQTLGFVPKKCFLNV